MTWCWYCPYQGEQRGGPPYHPRMMVRVLLYGYCTGVASSRRMAQRLHEDIAFRVLAANNTPDFRTISDFRKDHLEALAGLFLQVLELCQRAGLVKLGHVALDGTLRANASKHKAMSYGRMKEKEDQLAAEVDELLRRAGEVDEEEDRRCGKDQRGDELPEELSFREGRLRKIREAKAALEAEARAEAEQAQAEGKKHPGEPDEKAQRNFTDPESDHARPWGTGLPAVLQLRRWWTALTIVAARATNLSSDKQQAVAMVEEAVGNLGRVPKEVSADAGYYSAKAVDDLCALWTRSWPEPEPAPRGRIPKGLSARDRMRRKLRTKRGRKRYALRMGTVEPVFGQIAGSWLPPVPAAGLGEQRGMESDLHRLPAEAVPHGAGRPGQARNKGPARTNQKTTRLAIGKFLWRFSPLTNSHCPLMAASS